MDTNDANHGDIEPRYERCRADLRARGQEHVLRWWPELSAEQRKQLLCDIESIPWKAVEPLIASHVRAAPAPIVPHDIRPATVYPRTPPPQSAVQYQKASELGRALIAQGKVAAFTVAGGQGTRLGIDGPKGTVPVTPVGDQTLFELFAQAILANRRRFGARIAWYVMTSPANHGQTVEFFERHDFFGLPRGDVSFFPQGMLPAFDREGRLLLEAKHRLSLAPDGHGGSLKALVRSGAIAEMKARGVEIISYFQVDNPLVSPIDPLFIGLHALTGSEMSTKVTAKADDLEKVGNVCLADGKLTVIEYSDFPNKLAHARNPDGTRRFDAGSLAIHLLNVSFVERVAVSAHDMPFRRAEKVVPCLDEQGALRRPASANAIKLEQFVFDVLPLAAHPLVFAVDRAEEFSPVKNPTGIDSLESSKRDQNRRACRRLEAAGLSIPRSPDGEPDVTVAISPLFALDVEELIAKREFIPPIRRGDTLQLP